MINEMKIWHKGHCHCQAVMFEVCAPANVTLTVCNCSMCDMTGFIHLIVGADDFRIVTGADNISTYSFNTHTAKHTFCKTCGIKPFYTPRSHPDDISVNFRCVDQSGFDKVIYEDFDGQNWKENVADLRNKP